jgi:hypothetical protein
MNKKKCSRCKKLLKLEYFWKCRSNTDGYQYYCKKCLEEYQSIYAPELKGKFTGMRDKTKDKLLEAYYKNPAPKSLTDWADLAGVARATVYRNRLAFKFITSVPATKKNDKTKLLYYLRIEEMI